MEARFFKKEDVGDDVLLQVEDGYSLSVVEIPYDLTPEEFFKSTENCGGVEVLEGAHFCPHVSPNRFDKFRKGTNKTETGVTLDVFYGRVTETDRWEVAATAYPAGVWGGNEAREHCKSCGGVAFQKAETSVEETRESEGSGLGEIVVKSIKKTDDYRHLVYGIVLEPGEVDLQRDVETEEEIEKAAHRYMIRMREAAKAEMVGEEHEEPLPDAVPVESYIAPADLDFPGGPVKKGSWVLVSYIPDKDVFDKIKSGKRTGYSVQGYGNRRPL